MGFISFQKLCLVLFFVLLSCYYISAFRLIHTSQQTHEIKVKSEPKETVKKIDDEIMSFKEKLKNQTNQQKASENEERVKTRIISEKKVKPMQSTLPDIAKEKILRAKLTKSDTSDESTEEEKPKPIIPKEKPDVKKIEAAKTKEPPKIVKEEIKKKIEKILELKEEKLETKITKEEIKIETLKPTEQPKTVKEEIKKKIEKLKEETKEIKKEEPHKIIVKKEETIRQVTPKPKEIKVETIKPTEEQKIVITKPVEEKKIVITKPAEKKKIVYTKPIEEKKIIISKPKEEPKVEITKVEPAKPKEVKKEIKLEAKVEVKPKPKSDEKKATSQQIKEPLEKIATTQQTKKPLKKEQVEPAKKEESKSVKIFDSTVTSLYFNLPSFSPNFDVVENEECKKQGHILIDQLNNHKLWALKMFDATAKIPSGILKGNLNQLGDYDQCVGIFTKIPIDEEKEEVKIAGKYCLANIDFEAETQEMKLPVHLAQSRALIRSKLQDPGHFIPRFTTIRWGLCIPSGCSAEDAENILEDSIRTYNESKNIGLHFDVSIEADQCYVRKLPKKLFDYHYSTLGTLALTASVGILVLIATLRDSRLFETEAKDEVKEAGKMEQILMSFSLKRTVTSFLRTESNSDEIECIHGVRAICTFMLYIAHKLIPMGHLPFTNKATLTEISNNPFSSILRLSIIYTDSFLLLSGILTSFSMSKDIEEKGRIPWFSRIVARFVRLTPSLLFVLLYYAYVLEILGDGPLWGTVITENVKLCQDSWWRNIFYIQNIYPFQEMCATHTHQLALDMQLSLIAPILVWLLYRRPILGVSVTVLLHLVSVVLRYYTTVNYRLSLVIYHGISISQLYRTANMLYASSIHRATPYIAGVGLGVLLRQIKTNCNISKVLLVLGWLVAGYFATWVLYTPSHLASRTYKYDINEAAQFSALCSLAWALALSWLIFSCFVHKQGYVNSILSSRPMVILSKISYTFYLIQFIVFFYNVGTVRTATEFKINSSLDLTELAIVIVIATLLTLLVDMPVQKIKTILLKSSPKSEESNSSPDTDKNTSNKVGNATENIKRVTISDNVEILDDHEVIDEETYHKYRQFSTESEPASEDFTEEESFDEDEELVQNLENKMRQFSTESETISEDEENSENRMRQQSLDEVEEITYDEDVSENHQFALKNQHSADEVDDIEHDDKLQSQYSTEDIEDTTYEERTIADEYDEEILKSVEDFQPSIKTQFTTEDINEPEYDEEIIQTIQSSSKEVVEEKTEEDEGVVKFVFRIRPSITRIVPEEDNKTAEYDEEIVRNLENNVRQISAENEPPLQPLNDDE